MRSLQKSSPNSCCRGGFHCVATMTGIGDSDPSRFARLDVLAHFGGQSNVNKGADNRRGLGTSDGVAEVANG